MEVCIGKVLKTKGLKGELVVYFSISKHNSKRGDFLFFDNKNEIIGPYRIEYLNFYKISKERSLYILKLEEINSIEDSYKLKGCFIIKDFDVLPTSIFYKKDIIGCNVILKNKNLNIGEVVDIIEVKENYRLLLVSMKNKEEIFIPFTKEFIYKIDVSEKIIFVDSTEEILEGYI